MDRIRQKVIIPIEYTKNNVGVSREELFKQEIGLPPVEYAKADIDTSKEEILKLINSIIVDEDFRARFNKSPEQAFKEIGISLDPIIVEKLKESTITEMLKDSYSFEEKIGIVPQRAGFIPALVLVGVIIGVIVPPPPVY